MFLAAHHARLAHVPSVHTDTSLNVNTNLITLVSLTVWSDTRFQHSSNTHYSEHTHVHAHMNEETCKTAKYRLYNGIKRLSDLHT